MATLCFALLWGKMATLSLSVFLSDPSFSLFRKGRRQRCSSLSLSLSLPSSTQPSEGSSPPSRVPARYLRLLRGDRHSFLVGPPAAPGPLRETTSAGSPHKAASVPPATDCPTPVTPAWTELALNLLACTHCLRVLPVCLSLSVSHCVSPAVFPWLPCKALALPTVTVCLRLLGMAVYILSGLIQDRNFPLCGSVAASSLSSDPYRKRGGKEGCQEKLGEHDASPCKHIDSGLSAVYGTLSPYPSLFVENMASEMLLPQRST